MKRKMKRLKREDVLLSEFIQRYKSSKFYLDKKSLLVTILNEYGLIYDICEIVSSYFKVRKLDTIDDYVRKGHPFLLNVGILRIIKIKLKNDIFADMWIKMTDQNQTPKQNQKQIVVVTGISKKWVKKMNDEKERITRADWIAQMLESIGIDVKIHQSLYQSLINQPRQNINLI